MISGLALQTALGPGLGRLLALAVIAAAPLLAWAVAAVLTGGPQRLARAARAVAHGAWATLGLILLLRGLDLLAPGIRGGPIGWLDVIGHPPTGWYPVDALLVLALAQSAALVVGASVAALGRGGSPAPEQPAAMWLSLVVSAAPWAGWIAAWASLSQQTMPIPGLDLLAAAPAALGALAVGLQAWQASAMPSTPVPAAPAGAPAVAPPEGQPSSITAWRAAGVIGSSAFLRLPATSEAGGDQVGWAEVGGHGGAPRALDTLLPAATEPGRLWLLPDAVDPTDRLVTLAAARAAVQHHGARVLLVADDPAAWTADLAALGSVTGGTVALKAAWSRGELPAVAVLSGTDLVSDAVSTLQDPRQPMARAWRMTLGLLILARVDRPGPLQLTHRLFALERLVLALSTTRYAVLATGFGGPGTRALLQRAFSDRVVEEVPTGPRSSPALETWLCDWRFQQAPGVAWPLRAARALSPPARLSDPRGTLDPTDAASGGVSVPLVHDLTLDGAASVAPLDARWLLAAVRSLPHRAATVTCPLRHDALWGLQDEPVTRFLADIDTLRNLASSQRLPAPRPVFGFTNRSIARAHLRAALAEAEQDVAGLRDAFGPSLVDEEVGQPATSTFRSRRDPQGRLVRTPLLPVRAGEIRVPPTVTEQILSIVDAVSGRAITEVDAIVAPTRIYPRRVFEHDGRRYEVGLHAHDERRARIEVQPVGADHPLTRPVLTSTLTFRQATESWQKVQRGRLTFRLGTWDAVLHETVAGVRRSATDRVAYPPVEARFRTLVRLVGFERQMSRDATWHLAASVASVLRAWLMVDEDDLGAVGIDAGQAEGWPAGICIIDRHVQGVGIAAALTEDVMADALEWVYTILHRCPCENGCARCTPALFLEEGSPSKAVVLSVLGG